jgi:small subunit ribosomal protein S16
MVKIRLARRGRKKLAMFDLVVANATAPRDGRFIEKLGTYNPNTIPATIVLQDDKALTWLMNGAQPTDTVRAILSYRGILYKKHLQIGVNKGALSQEDADAKFEAWKSGKDSKISGRVDNLAKAKADATKSRLEAETKVNEARIAAQAAKQAAEIAAAAPPVVEEVVAEEVAAVEAPAEEVASVEVTPEEVVAEAAPVEEVASVEAAAEEVVAAEAPAEEVAPVAAAEEVAPSAETETPTAE